MSLEQTPHSAQQRATVFYMLAVGAFAAIFAIWQVASVPWEVYFTCVALWAVCLFPLARWYARSHVGLPMFEMICVAYGLQFSMPVFLQPNLVSTIYGTLLLRWSAVLEALVITLLGVSALIGGYYLALRWRLVTNTRPIDLPLNPARRPIYLALAFILGLTMTLALNAGSFTVDSSLGAIADVVANQLRLALIVLTYQVYGSSHPRRGLVWLLYLMVLILTGVGLLSGMLEHVLIPLILIFLVRWQATRKLPVDLIVLGFVGFIVLNAAKSSYREQVWYADQPLTVDERLSLWADLSQDVVSATAQGDVGTNVESLVRESMARFDMIHKFAYVRDMTPKVVPFYEGATYQYLLVGWIPRLFWPDKPNASESNHRTDVDYGFLYSRQTSSTTIALGQLPEAYINFGALAVIPIMLLQGLVFGAMNHLYNGSRSDGGRAIYLSLMVSFLNGIGSSTAVWFGALFQHLVANTLILRVFSTDLRSLPDVDVRPDMPAVDSAATPSNMRALQAKRQRS